MPRGRPPDRAMARTEEWMLWSRGQLALAVFVSVVCASRVRGGVTAAG